MVKFLLFRVGFFNWVEWVVVCYVIIIVIFKEELDFVVNCFYIDCVYIYIIYNFVDMVCF